MNVSVVIPVYNSSATLVELIRQIMPILATCAKEFEIILVDDSSKDNSWQMILDLSQTYSQIRGIGLMRNYGQHNALLCGIRRAQYEVTVTLDDDLQNPPSEIPKLLAKLQEGHDVVYGFPLQQQHGLYRNLGSTLTKWVLKNAMGAATAHRIGPFRAFRTQLREAFATYQSPNVTIDVLLTWGTCRFSAVPVQHFPRNIGKSNYTFMRLVSLAFNLLTGFSTLPLQFASWNGFACVIFGMLAMMYVLGRYLIEGGSVPGFPFLACLVVIFSGAQLFAIGIIGEYLARMHGRIIERPAYVVRSTSGNSINCEPWLTDNAQLDSAPPIQVSTTAYEASIR